MSTLVVPPLNAWAFSTTISATPTSSLNTAIPQHFRSLRGVFKITVINYSKHHHPCKCHPCDKCHHHPCKCHPCDKCHHHPCKCHPCDKCHHHPYYFSFVMKGGTGRFRGDPGRPFYYLLNTAIDNLLNPLKVETTSYPIYTDVQILTKNPNTNPILYNFTFPIGITQFTFPSIQRLSGAKITGDVVIKVENYTPVRI